MPLNRADHGRGAPDRRQDAAGKVPQVEAFERLKQLVVSAEEDIKKAEGGNKAAGTRARQIMQDVKNRAQEVRQQILAIRSTEKPG